MILYKIVADEILAVVEKKLCSEFNSFLGIDANPVISVHQQDFNLDQITSIFYKIQQNYFFSLIRKINDIGLKEIIKTENIYLTIWFTGVVCKPDISTKP